MLNMIVFSESCIKLDSRWDKPTSNLITLPPIYPTLNFWPFLNYEIIEWVLMFVFNEKIIWSKHLNHMLYTQWFDLWSYFYTILEHIRCLYEENTMTADTHFVFESPPLQDCICCISTVKQSGLISSK